LEESKRKYEVAGWLEEIARAPIAFKHPHAQRLAETKARYLVEAYLDARHAHFRHLFHQIGGTVLVYALATGGLFAIGGSLVVAGKLTLGQLVAAEVIVASVAANFAKFGKYFESYYDLLAGLDKLGHLFDLPVDSEGIHSLPKAAEPMAIELRDVSLRYPGAPRPTLGKVNLRIEPGERLGVYGLNGSGKSSVMQLIYGVVSPDSGSVTADQLDLRALSSTSYRNQVAYVSEPLVFDGTLLENLLAGGDVDLSRVVSVCKLLGIHSEIETLPEGFGTRLGGTFSPLSAGLTQMVAIARAVISEPRLLLVDGAMEQIDQERREVVLKALSDPAAPWTLVVATRDLYDLSHCSRVIRLEEGEILQ
jgi:ABC-type bacteriocin/lantibiotic exporter with double-glycine peptidase domain